MELGESVAGTKEVLRISKQEEREKEGSRLRCRYRRSRGETKSFGKLIATHEYIAILVYHTQLYLSRLDVQTI